MKKKIFLFIFILSILFFGICVIMSSPYRELRPYFLYNLFQKDQNHTQILKSNNKRIVLIDIGDGSDSFYIDQRPVTIKEYKKASAPNAVAKQHYRDIYAKYYANFWYNDLPVSFGANSIRLILFSTKGSNLLSIANFCVVLT